MAIYQHIRHPRIASRLAEKPVKVADMPPQGTAVSRFNTRVAILITKAVGSMWCAYAFALFDLISLPSAIRGGAPGAHLLGGADLPATGPAVGHHGGQNVQGTRRTSGRRRPITSHAALHEVAHLQAISRRRTSC